MAPGHKNEDESPRKDQAKRMAVDERRSQLLELGIELFSHKSPDDISIDDIAKAAGISKGLLYHYFGGKRAYYVATVQLAAQQLLEHTKQEEEIVADDPLQSLQAGLEAYLDHVAARATGFVMLVTSGTADPEVRAVVEATRAEFVNRIHESLGLPVAPPVLRSALRGWIAYVEASSLDWLEHGGATRDQMRSMLAATFLGILKAAGVPISDEMFEAVQKEG